MSDKMYDEIFDMLVDECRDMCIDVSLVEDSSFFDHDMSLIGIDLTMPKEEQVFTLMHEIGHAVIQFDECEYETAYPAKSSPRDFSFDDWIHDVLREEEQAWRIGLTFLSDKNIINVDAFYQLMNDCLEDYQRWSQSFEARTQWASICSNLMF